MAKHTVDEFVIELGFSEKVMKGLAKLEKQVLPVAQRIEKSLNKAFQVDGSKQMAKTFSKIVKDADSASRKIKKSLTNAFDIKGAGRASLRGFENEANAMARRVAKEIQKAYRTKPTGSPRPPVGGGAGGTGGGRPPRGGGGYGGAGGGGSRTANWIESHFLRNTESGMTATMQRRGMTTELGAFRSQMEALRDKHRNDTTTHEYEKNARQLIWSYKDQIRQHKENAKAAERARFMQRNLESSTMNMIKGFGSAYAMLNLFTSSLEEGAKRTQAHTMSVAAYGNEQEALRMMGQADKVSEAYGLNTLNTREQMAQMRMTMPKSFSNDKLAQLFENEAVFAHTTGMSQDAVGRLNYAMQQIAASPHLMGQDFIQVINSSPALVNKLIEKFGVKDSKELKEKAKSMSGADFVEQMMEAMQPTALQRKQAQENIIAAQGRLNNSVSRGQDYFFRGFEKGIRILMEALTAFLNMGDGTFKKLGEVLGYVATKLANGVYVLASIMQNISGYLQLASEKIAQMRKDSVVFNELIEHLNDIATVLIPIMGIAAAFKIIASFMGIFSGVATLLKTIGKIGGLGAAVTGGTEVAASAAVAEGGLGTLAGVVAALGGWPVILGAAAAAAVAYGIYAAFQTDAGKDVISDGKEMLKSIGESQTFKDLQKYDKQNHMTTSQYTYGAPLSQQPGYSFATGAVPGVPGQNMLTVAPLQIEIVNKGDIELRMPDGTIQKVALEAVQQQHEVQMMSAQGLKGQWQSPTQNAGWSPSLLQRAK